MPDPSSSSSASASASTSSERDRNRSLFGTDPLDEVVCFVGGFIYAATQGGAVLNEFGPAAAEDVEIEVEAKLGTLIDTRTGMRVHLPVANETILSDTSNVRFESGMSVEQHRHFNTLLNSLCVPDASRPRLQYKRHQEIDYFYASQSHGHGREKVRVTREADSLRTKERGSVVKRRLANLEVHCPNRAFDYRISVNLEIQAPEPPPDATHDFYREKNRLSYTHTGMRVDLTQVKVPPQGGGPGEPTLQHELEVELLAPPPEKDASSPSSSAHSGNPNPFPLNLITPHSSSLTSPSVLGAGHNSAPPLNGHAGGQDWTEYEDTILRFLNDVRLLIRNTGG